MTPFTESLPPGSSHQAEEQRHLTGEMGGPSREPDPFPLEDSFARAIIHRAAEGICVCHEVEEYPHLRFTVWNDRMKDLTGYTREEINRLGWYQSVYPDPQRRQQARERMAAMRRGHDLRDEEWEITRADGEKRMVSISTSVVSSRGGVVHVLGLMHDITARKTAEDLIERAREDLEQRVRERTRELVELNEKLRLEMAEKEAVQRDLKQSEERYRLVVEGTGTGIWDWDRTTNKTYYSDQYKKMLGLFHIEGWEASNDWKERIHPQDRDRVLRTHRECYNGLTEKFDIEYRLLHGDGSYRWIQCRGMSIKDQGGRVCRMTGTHADISQRKGVEERLKQNESLLRNAQRIARLGSFERDLRTGDLFGTEACYELLGQNSDPVPPSPDNLWAHVHPQDRTMLEHAIAEPLPSRTPLEIQFRIIGKDGEVRHVNLILNTECDIEGNPVCQHGTLQDVTERRRIEEELRAANENLEEIVSRRTVELESKTRSIEDINATLRTLLRCRDDDLEEVRETVLANIKERVLPYLKNLRTCRAAVDQSACIDLIEANLREIASPFVRKLSRHFLDLTPTEIRVAEMIKTGMSTKDIAQLLFIAPSTVVTHRESLRKKLGLTGTKTNLRSYLQSLA